MNTLLQYFRSSLEQYTQLLDCELCVNMDEYNPLLATAGQCMSIICERTVHSYVKLRRDSQQQLRFNQMQGSQMQGSALPEEWGTSSSITPQNDGEERNNLADRVAAGTTGDGDMWFLTYRIKSSHERLQVLQCLVVIHLNELSQLLTRLKARASNQNKSLFVLAEAEERVRSAQVLLCMEKE